VEETTWAAYYAILPDGRCKITSPALLAFGLKYRKRILETQLWGLPATVLFLDKPLKLGERVGESDLTEYYLRRIPLHELPGWPPRVAAGALGTPPFLESTLKSAAMVRGSTSSQDGVLLTLSFKGTTFTAWLVGCPTPLLECAEATLNQKGCIGKRLSDLQDLRLVCG
jgi:hypothetical protein